MCAGFHIDAAKWLVANRKISGIGTDSMCVDNGQTLDFKVHVTMGENNKFSKAIHTQILDFVITFSKFTVDGPSMALTANIPYL